MEAQLGQSLVGNSGVLVVNPQFLSILLFFCLEVPGMNAGLKPSAWLAGTSGSEERSV